MLSWPRIVVLSYSLLTPCLPAQVPAAVGVVDDELIEQRILQQCMAARAKGQLVLASTLAEQLGRPGHHSSSPIPLRTERLEGPQLRANLFASVRIVGHYYLCNECSEWHFSGATGFHVDAAGAVATCAHVVAPDETMLECYLIVADLDGTVWPVREVIASSIDADVCVLRTDAKHTQPLPLRLEVAAGERVYCLSNPDHQFAFFSDGLVARWYMARPNAEDAAGAAIPWLHVTCDFAKGSSGAPIVDAMGNVVGIAQSTTTVVYDELAETADTQMVFKTAAPAQALARLREPAKTSAGKSSEAKH